MRSDVSRTIVLGAMGTPRSTFPAAPREAQRARRGGARRDRTDDLMLAKHALSQLSYGPVLEDECFCCARLRWRYGAAAFVQEACRAEAAEQRRLVGLGRLELPTSRLSSARSNQLSYKPLTLILRKGSGPGRRAPAHRQCIAQAQAPGACSSAKKEKRRRRNPANGAQQS
jgi:hypothetical protein